MGAHGSHRAKRTRLLLIALGIAIAATACGTNDTRPPATSGTIAAQASGAAATAEVVRLFDYDRQRPLAVTKPGGNTGRPPAQAPDGITVEAITYASPKGGEVPALVVAPRGRGRSPASSLSTVCRPPRRTSCRLGSTWPAPGR